MGWGWGPVGEPDGPGGAPGDDWVSWWWSMQHWSKGMEDVEVRLTSTLVECAEAGDPDLDERALDAVRTRGRSEVARLEAWEELPERIECGTKGCKAIGGHFAAPR